MGKVHATIEGIVLFCDESVLNIELVQTDLNNFTLFS